MKTKMDVPQHPVHFALPDLGEAEIAEVVDSLRSGWITTGPKAARFEREFAALMGDGVHAVAVNSATAGLHLALEALGLGPGDEVIVPVHTFTATAEVVRYVGADPVFVDVEPDGLTIDPEAIARAVTPRTRAIIPVHYGGLACRMGPILALAEERGLAIVEDAAHSLPTTWEGRIIGSLPTAATVFSFYATKTLATGEGGMLVTRDEKIANRARVMRLHGINRDVFDRYQAGGSWYYEVVAPGFKYNLTDIAASIGLHQLARLEEMRSKRAAIAEAYEDAFRNLPLILPAKPPGTDMHAWHLYPVRLRTSRMDRDALIDRFRAEQIGTSVHYVPLHMHPYWRGRYALTEDQFPVSTAAYRAMVSLPIYSKMTAADVERVTSVMKAALG
jgi:dTDP-4-amino-4,6-dideoxygalactose transaminase